MLDKMLGLVKGEVAKVVGGMASVPQDKQGAVVDTAASSLMGGLRKFATPSALGALLGGGSAAGSTSGAGAMGSLSSGMISDLVSKVGLSSSAAKGIAASVVPAVMGMLGKQSGGSGGLNIQSMIGALAGGGSAASGSGGGLDGMLGSLMGGGSNGPGGGLGGMLGGLFGKK